MGDWRLYETIKSCLLHVLHISSTLIFAARRTKCDAKMWDFKFDSDIALTLRTGYNYYKFKEIMKKSIEGRIICINEWRVDNSGFDPWIGDVDKRMVRQWFG
jgi:hypothetical protein